MPALTTARLTCSPLQEQDWPFFLSLQQNPEVMRFVAPARSEATFGKPLSLVCCRGRRAARTGSALWCVKRPARRRWA